MIGLDGLTSLSTLMADVLGFFSTTQAQPATGQSDDKEGFFLVE